MEIHSSFAPRCFYTTIKWQNQTYDDMLYRKSREIIWVELLKRRNLEMLISVRRTWYIEWLRYVVCVCFFHMWEIIFHTKSLDVTAASIWLTGCVRYKKKNSMFVRKKNYQQEDWWWGKNIENKTSAKVKNKCMAIKQSRKKL